MNLRSSGVVFIGLDAMSPVVIDEMMAAGLLPNLRALLDQGRGLEVSGLPGLFVGSTWPSIATGTGPASHGFHYQIQLEAGTYDWIWPQDHGVVRTQTFWMQASEAGRRVSILDVPLSSLADNINGQQVVEWGGHDVLFGFSASTSELKQRISDDFGPHPAISPCDNLPRTSHRGIANYVEQLVAGVELKRKMTLALLAEADWDLFAQVFTESHCVGHQCWHLHDELHPAHDPDYVRDHGDPVQRVYQSIDNAVGDLIDAIGDHRHVVVLASHGMSHWYGAQFLLRDVLERLGALQRAEASTLPPPSAYLRPTIARLVWRTLPAGLRSAVRRPVKDFLCKENRTGRTNPRLSADEQTSKCFVVPNGHAVGGIRLNIAGREPLGVLEPGVEVDEFCERLISDLLDIVDQRTGAPAIRAVYRTEDLFDGEVLGGLPDLLVEWDDTVPTGSTGLAGGRAVEVNLASPKIGQVVGSNLYTRTGENRADGLLVVKGPGIVPSVSREVCSVLDVAPTIASLLDLPTDSYEGSPVPRMFE